MTPLELYRQRITSQNFNPDAQQQQAILSLQDLHAQLCAEKSVSWRQRLVSKLTKTGANPLRGVYLWGGVGIGKTWLMDIFYDTLPTKNKLRMHFHRFMQEVHLSLKALEGHADPLTLVARRFAEKTSIICFDEFLVNDIVDAMILGNLLRALFAEGITLVTTANNPPDELYRNGIQREYFLPAIELLKQHLTVIHLTTIYDYRLRELEGANNYYYPLNEMAVHFLRQKFIQLSHVDVTRADVSPLVIEGREIITVAHHAKTALFDFSVLCHVPRSQLDYLAIAQRFENVLLSNVPQITAQQDNIIRYFINLIDIFYDARVKLIITAAVSIPELYLAGRLLFDFKRTQSRLLEMQSQDYLLLPHLGEDY